MFAAGIQTLLGQDHSVFLLGVPLLGVGQEGIQLLKTRFSLGGAFGQILFKGAFFGHFGIQLGAAAAGLFRLLLQAQPLHLQLVGALACFLRLTAGADDVRRSLPPRRIGTRQLRLGFFDQQLLGAQGFAQLLNFLCAGQ